MHITLLTRDAILAKSVTLMLADGELGSLDCPQSDIAHLERPDVLILDARFPQSLMVHLRKRIAQWGKAVPTLVLTGSERDAVPPSGFERADTLSTPYHRGDLVARIRANYQARDGIIRVGRLTLDPCARRAHVDSRPVKLTAKEYEVLEFLATRLGTTLTKDMFLDRLYGGRDEPEIKIIDVFVCKIRRKLKALTGGDPLIATVWGRGYVLRDPDRATDAARRKQATG